MVAHAGKHPRETSSITYIHGKRSSMRSTAAGAMPMTITNCSTTFLTHPKTCSMPEENDRDSDPFLCQLVLMTVPLCPSLQSSINRHAALASVVTLKRSYQEYLASGAKQ
jgi:hypothetical protein